MTWHTVKATGGFTFVERANRNGPRFAFQFDDGDAAQLASYLNQLEGRLRAVEHGETYNYGVRVGIESQAALFSRVLRCLAEFRRLGNQTVSDSNEVARCHQEADFLLATHPELDDPNERYDAPHRVEHREFVASLFKRRKYP